MRTRDVRVVFVIFLAAVLYACAAGTARVRGGTAVSTADQDQDVTGRCEVVVDGRTGPCDGITLFLRHRRSGEERRAEINGYDFRFRDLNQRSYVLSATSRGYDVQSNVRDEVTPGQVVQLRLRADPR